MRLNSVIVRNYRIHRDTRVEFAPGITLIQGPNESGKSTLVEALHRVLFLRARAGGDVLATMASVWGTHPEIELACSVAGVACGIRKVFKGARGQTTLSLAGEPTLTGDAAEERLAALLHVAAPIEGRGAAGLLGRRWAHLWVWQGSSGADPASSIAEQHDTLLRRLQRQGGAAVMQSALDARVVADLRQRRDAIFAAGGRYRVGSEVARAQDVAGAAAADVQAAQQTLLDLQDACDRHARAARTITEKEQAQREGEAALRAAEAKLKQAEQIAQRLTPLRQRLAELGHEKQQLQKIGQDLASARDTLASLQKTATAQGGAVTAERDEQRAAQAAAESAETEWQGARALLETAGQARNALGEHVAALQKRDELARRQTVQATVRAKRAKLDALQRKLAGMPAVTDKDVKTLRKLDQALATARATLEAQGAGIELLASTEPVLVNGEPLAVGTARVMTDDAEIAVGTQTRLRIRPGGSTSLAEARQTAVSARAALDGKLRELALDTLDAAVAASEMRKALATQAETLTEQLTELGEETIDALVLQAEAAAAEAVRKAEFAAAAAQLLVPADADAAQTAKTTADEQVRAAEQAEKRTARAYDTARGRRDRQAAKLADVEKAVATLNLQMQQQEARITALLETHGTDAEREARSRVLVPAARAAEDALRAAENDLAALQPDLLREDMERLQAAVARAGAAIGTAQQEQAAARERLRLRGTSDPHAELALAKVRQERADTRFRELELQARAVQRLVDLADAAQRDMAEQFTRPLTDAVQGYLECIFGPGATIRIGWDPAAGEFSGLQVVRDRAGLGTFAFADLSGGAREQVGIAMRLAMAQVLAAEHDGCLPVVLDDAFVNSDPERVAVLQRMLYRAAANGLQIIVLTCNPAHYRTLGASEVALRPPVLPAPGPAPAATDAAPDDATAPLRPA